MTLSFNTTVQYDRNAGVFLSSFVFLRIILVAAYIMLLGGL
jgi:hypothetical protein